MSRQFPPGSPQAMQVAIGRVVEAINDINECLPTTSGVQAATAGLINACTTFDTAVSVLSLQLETAICWLGNGGAGINCTYPDQCPYYTIEAISPESPTLLLWDPYARGFLVTGGTSVIGDVCFAPGSDVDPHNMAFLTSIILQDVEVIAGLLHCMFQEKLLTFQAPKLTSVGGNCFVNSNSSQTTIDLSALVTVGGTLDLGGTLITTVDLSSLTTVNGAEFDVGGQVMQDILVPNLTTFDGDVFCQNSALSEDTVNGLLIAFDNCVLTNHTVRLDGGTSAAPSGAGITAKNNLTGRGCSVYTN